VHVAIAGFAAAAIIAAQVPMAEAKDVKEVVCGARSAPFSTLPAFAQGCHMLTMSARPHTHVPACWQSIDSSCRSSHVLDAEALSVCVLQPATPHPRSASR